MYKIHVLVDILGYEENTNDKNETTYFQSSNIRFFISRFGLFG